MLLLAQAIGGYSIIHLIIMIIIVAAVVAIMYVALRQFGIQIPPWVVQMFWIVVVAVVAIFLIKVLLSMS